MEISVGGDTLFSSDATLGGGRSYPQWVLVLAFMDYVILKSSGNKARIWLVFLAYDIKGKEP